MRLRFLALSLCPAAYAAFSAAISAVGALFNRALEGMVPQDRRKVALAANDSSDCWLSPRAPRERAAPPGLRHEASTPRRAAKRNI